jgi:hypothetical protein
MIVLSKLSLLFLAFFILPMHFQLLSRQNDKSSSVSIHRTCQKRKKTLQLKSSNEKKLCIITLKLKSLPSCHKSAETRKTVRSRFSLFDFTSLSPKKQYKKVLKASVKLAAEAFLFELMENLTKRQKREFRNFFEAVKRDVTNEKGN